MDRKIYKIVIISFTIITVFYQSQSMAQLFYSDYNRYQEDVKIANQIGYRIMDLDLGEIPPYPVVYLGKHVQPIRANVIKQEVLGFSFFEWDGGNYNRIGNFMKSVGYDYLDPTEEQREKAIKIADSMPTWPHKGSVALKNDLIIVNLSENPEKYKLNLHYDDSTIQKEMIFDLNIAEKVDYYNDLEIEKADSSDLILKAGKLDPYVSISLGHKLEKDSYSYISFEINSSVDGDMQLFLLQENDNYSEKYSGIIKVKKGINRIYCDRNQLMNNLISIRIDPPVQSTFEVKKISFFK